MCTAFGVDHSVVDERVLAGCGQGEFDEAALGGGEVEGLGGAVFEVARAQQVGALLEYGVELGADDVE